jgi:uncharacterized membrane protein
MVDGAIALAEPAVNTIAYYGHDRVWNRQKRVQWLSLHQLVQHVQLFFLRGD